jgi:mono/diheme cytochrome c family protein
MDCITCHNRITHLVDYPEQAIDTLLQRGLISTEIPEIRRVALETYTKDYSSLGTAEKAFDLLDYFYQQQYPDYYAGNQAVIDQAIAQLKTAYTNSVFPEQNSDWTSHPNNIGHKNSAGCFRCHDGQHFDDQQEAIRLECNLCHAIPVVSDQGDYLTQIEISKGPEPQSHLNTSWISLHHLVYDPTCGNCHSMADPGGDSNTSFCSNSACHGASWDYAGFDAPSLRETLLDQLPTPVPTLAPVIPEDPEDITYTTTIQAVLLNRCGACHGESGQAGLHMDSYDSLLAGSANGPVIVPGDPEGSLLLIKTAEAGSHFAQFTDQERNLIETWIREGAAE